MGVRTCCDAVDAAEGCKLSVSTGLTASDSTAEAPPRAATVAVSSCCTSDLQQRRHIRAAAHHDNAHTVPDGSNSCQELTLSNRYHASPECHAEAILQTG